MTSTLYVDALKSAFPAQYVAGIEGLPPSTLHLLDAVIRFTSGGEWPVDAQTSTKESWKAAQDTARRAFDALAPSTANGHSKRARDDEGVSEDHPTKKSRPTPTQDGTSAPTFAPEDDIPLYTLHAFSLQSPVRRKLDIVICRYTLQLIQPTAREAEVSIPLSSLKRAFLLNTRGKTKAHWTVALLASDTVAPKLTGKAAQAAAAAASANGEPKAEERQIVFGVDAQPSVWYTTTDHTTSPPTRTAHSKNAPTLPHLRAFLSHLPIPYTEPDLNVFRASASSGGGGEPIAGVEAYRAAKEGTLWFFSDGILWDGRPCEFWSLESLVPGTAEGEDDAGPQAVRFVSATGKTGSVFIRRRVPSAPVPENGEEEEEEEEYLGGEYVEAGFNPVDAKEREEILRWAKKRRNLFGVDPSQGTEANGAEEKVDVKGKGKAVALPEDDSDDEDDSDFVGDSDTDGGSPSGSDSEDDDEEGGNEAEGDSDDDGEGEAGEEEEELDPKHHPLLRAGAALPRMSRAAMDMAVGMVAGDLLAASSSQRAARGEDSGDEEEDELDD